MGRGVFNGFEYEDEEGKQDPGPHVEVHSIIRSCVPHLREREQGGPDFESEET